MSTVLERAAPPAAPPVPRRAAYMDPYLAGIGIGVALLIAYAIAGRGLGASGAFASIAAAGVATTRGVAESAGNPAFAPYLERGVASPLTDWLVLELLGVTLGGFVSARLAGRFHIGLDRGSIGAPARLIVATSGGVIMGIGAKLARGCTSGQALTGGALLSVGSWIFIASCFAAGYLVAPVVRRVWQ